MKHLWVTPLAIALGVAAFASTCRGQDQSATQQPSFYVSVDRVQVSAVVTDSKGRHVPDLGMADFVVVDDGKAQQLTHCEYIRLTSVPAERAQGLPQSGSTVAPAREQVRRTIVFLVDDESLAADAIPVVRGAIKSATERSLLPGDLVALIRTSSGNGMLEQFTSDRRVLLESCERIRWRPESRGNPGMLRQTSGTVVGENSSQYVVNLSFERTTEVLRYVISALRELPGRKAIMLISQSFPYWTKYSIPRSATPAATPVGEMVDRALRAGVVIYGVDPTPLSSLTPGAGYDVTREFTAQAGGRTWITDQDAARLPRIYTSRALALLEFARSGLRAVAEGTGGLMGAETDAATALGRFADDLQGYYVLTYKPRAPGRYFDAKEGQPQPFHSVTVRVRPRGLHVRTYAGYMGGAGPAEADTSAYGELSKALFSPFSASGIRVGLTPVFTQPRPAAPELSLLLHIDARDLRFTPGEDGRRRAGFQLVARAADDRDDPAQVVTREVSVQLEERSYREAIQMGLVYRVSVPAARAGLYDVRVAIREAESGRLGSARDYVEVPDLGNGRPAVSGVLVYSASPRQGDAFAPGAAERRLFRREDSLTFACQVFNAKSIQVEAQIVRDGRPVMTVPVEAAGSPEGTSTVKGAAPLAKLTPGSYILQITARRAPGKEAAASQWTDFEIVP